MYFVYIIFFFFWKLIDLNTVNTIFFYGEIRVKILFKLKEKKKKKYDKTAFILHPRANGAINY